MTMINNISEAYSGIRSNLGALNVDVMKARDDAVREAADEGYPTTRHEEWKYTSLRPLLDARFALKISESEVRLTDVERKEIAGLLVSHSSALVFVDGNFCAEFSSALEAGVVVTQLAASEKNAGLPWQKWNAFPGLSSIFGRLARGFAQHGVVVEVSEKSELKKPLHILHVTTTRSASICRASRVVVVAATGSKSEVFEEFISLGDAPSYSLPLTQIYAGPNAKIGYYRVSAHNEHSFQTGHVTIELGRDARVETFSLTRGGRLVRVNMDAVYTAPGAECVLDGLYLVGEAEHVDHHTSIDHTVGQCRTLQLYKGIVAGRGRAVFNGKIFIRPDAKGSEAFQTNKNLLLSTDAEVDTKPELVIDNDDVKASHGAAIGAIDPMELFYLQSRCIGRAEAEAILCRGFADEVVMRLESKKARSVLNTRIGAWFASRSQ